MAEFNGQLGSNEIYAAIFNMIISQRVFADNIANTNPALLDLFRTDGTLYGDRKLYYDTDILSTHAWGADAEAQNLLALDRAKAPKCQVVILDQFRQIRLTTDEYLSKRAWTHEGAFSEFNSVLMGWMRDTKRVYDSALINSFVGTNETNIGEQEITINYPAIADGATNTEAEAHNRLVAQQIATELADLEVAISDPGTAYNDYGHYKSYNWDDLIVVWNADVSNKIRYTDLPTIYHKDGATPMKFDQYRLPSRFFGTVITANGTSTGAQRTLVEKVYAGSTVTKNCFPGDLIPAGAQYLANEAYTEDSTILFKVMHKQSVPFMSAFEVGTSFYNPRSLTTNHYLTFGFSSPTHLSRYPFITVRGRAQN